MDGCLWPVCQVAGWGRGTTKWGVGMGHSSVLPWHFRQVKDNHNIMTLLSIPTAHTESRKVRMPQIVNIGVRPKGAGDGGEGGETGGGGNKPQVQLL